MISALHPDLDPIRVAKALEEDAHGLPVGSGRFRYSSEAEVALARTALAPLVTRFVESGSPLELVFEFLPGAVSLHGLASAALLHGGMLAPRVPRRPPSVLDRLARNRTT